MTDLTFTGERLHEGNPLFGVDLARHRAAYQYAKDRSPGLRVLDLGSGSGYGTAELAGVPSLLVGLDRVRPDRGTRGSEACFVRGDLNAMPLASDLFDLVVSFQVIEHLEDPTLYLKAMSQMLRPEGLAIVTTPNLVTSDRENPYHVHEYTGDELAATLGHHFDSVEMRGVGMSEPAARYHEARLQRIQKIVRIDPFKAAPQAAPGPCGVALRTVCPGGAARHPARRRPPGRGLAGLSRRRRRRCLHRPSRPLPRAKKRVTPTPSGTAARRNRPATPYRADLYRYRG